MKVRSCTTLMLTVLLSQPVELMETEHVIVPTTGLTTPIGSETGVVLSDPLAAPRRSNRQRRPRVLFSP